jgi:hypothetical protein
MQIFVTILTGKIYTLEVEPNDYVYKVKKIMQDIYGPNPE